MLAGASRVAAFSLPPVGMTQQIARVDADSGPLGAVHDVQVVEPLPDGGCSALAFSCEHGVLVFWSPLRLGACHRGTGAAAAAPMLTRFDEQAWTGRRAHWCVQLAAIGVDLMADVPAPGLSRWRRQALTAPAWTGKRWRLECRGGLGGVSIGMDARGVVSWRDASAADDGERPSGMQPVMPEKWLLPDTRVAAGWGAQAFQSAVFEGWPLSWRRQYAMAHGLSATAPVNSRANLPQSLRDGPAMSAWVSRALQERIAAWPLLRRRLARLERPDGLPGVTDDDLVRWWPRWQRAGPTTTSWNS